MILIALKECRRVFFGSILYVPAFPFFWMPKLESRRTGHIPTGVANAVAGYLTDYEKDAARRASFLSEKHVPKRLLAHDKFREFCNNMIKGIPEKIVDKLLWQRRRDEGSPEVWDKDRDLRRIYKSGLVTFTEYGSLIWHVDNNIFTKTEYHALMWNKYWDSDDEDSPYLPYIFVLTLVKAYFDEIVVKRKDELQIRREWARDATTYIKSENRKQASKRNRNVNVMQEELKLMRKRNEDKFSLPDVLPEWMGMIIVGVNIDMNSSVSMEFRDALDWLSTCPVYDWLLDPNSDIDTEKDHAVRKWWTDKWHPNYTTNAVSNASTEDNEYNTQSIFTTAQKLVGRFTGELTTSEAQRLLKEGQLNAYLAARRQIDLIKVWNMIVSRVETYTEFNNNHPDSYSDPVSGQVLTWAQVVELQPYDVPISNSTPSDVATLLISQENSRRDTLNQARDNFKAFMINKGFEETFVHAVLGPHVPLLVHPNQQGGKQDAKTRTRRRPLKSKPAKKPHTGTGRHIQAKQCKPFTRTCPGSSIPVAGKSQRSAQQR